MIFIIDTNIIFSAMLKDSITRLLLIDSPFILYAPEAILNEIKKYKLDILKRSGLNAEEFEGLFELLTEDINIIEKEKYSEKLKGMKKTEQHKQKLRLKRIGTKNPYLSKLNKIRNIEDNPYKYVRNISKPQKTLFINCEQEYYPFEVFCNYNIKLSNGRAIFLDVAIPELGLNFEYDGYPWHEKTKEKDAQRDLYLEKLGWEVIRIQGDKH